jgi:elongator complex protein 1
MSSYVITLPSTPANISCSATDDSVAVLFGNGVVQVYDLNTKIPDLKSGSKLRGGGKVAEPRLRWEAKLAPAGVFAAKQIILAAGEVAALFWTDNEGGGTVVTARDGQVGLSKTVQGDVERLIWGEEAGWLVLDREGTLVAGELTGFCRRRS